MRKIKYFDSELSVEEYIKMQICKNAGTQSFAYKDQLCDLCESLEKKGILKVVGEYRFRAYGKYMYAPLYDIFQFASIPEEVIKNI